MRKLRLPAAIWMAPAYTLGLFCLIMGAYNQGYSGAPGAPSIPSWALASCGAVSAAFFGLGRLARIDWFWTRPRGYVDDFIRRVYTREYDARCDGILDGLLSLLNHIWFVPGLLSPLFIRGRDGLGPFAYVALTCLIFWLPYWLLLIWRLNQPQWADLATKD